MTEIGLQDYLDANRDSDCVLPSLDEVIDASTLDSIVRFFRSPLSIKMQPQVNLNKVRAEKGEDSEDYQAMLSKFKEELKGFED